MSALEEAVARHYARADLLDRILGAVAQAGLDPDRLAPEDLAAVDEFHSGWRPQTVEFAKALRLAPGMTVLDVGSGLGGPARHFAAAHGCDVTGLDLTPDFVATATALSERTGTAARTRFVTGSALAMPFDDGSFDVATLIHVGMNIADKARLFAEVRRVLRPGGRFGLFEVVAIGDGEVPMPMPMPWATEPEESFVEPLDRYRSLLREAGFEIEDERDRTGFVLGLARAMREKASVEGTPVLALHLVIGPTARERVGRLVGCFEAGTLAPVEIIATRG